MQPIDEAKLEIKFWKALALHLADCHAATAQYDGTLKSCSKSRRNRFAAICETAAKAIEFGHYVPRNPRSEEEVMTRCREAAVEMRRR